MSRLPARLFLLWFILGLACPPILAQKKKTTSWDKEKLQQMYLGHLKENGFIGAFVDDDGDVQFKYEAKTYYIAVDENDLQFFRVVLANIWSIDDEKEGLYAIMACNQASNRTKVAKAYVANGNVLISTEIFVNQPEDFKGVFMRTLSVIGTCKGHYVTEMNKFSAAE